MNPGLEQAKDIIKQQFSEWLKCTSGSIKITPAASMDSTVYNKIRPGFELHLPNDLHFRVIYRKGVNSTQLIPFYEHLYKLVRKKSHAPLLIVLPYFTPAIIENFEKHNISWMDLCGNATIRQKDIIINVSGEKNRFKKQKPSTSIFSSQRSRIIRAFLINPTQEKTQKKLVDETLLSQPTVSRVCRKMVELGLLLKIGEARPAKYKLLYPEETLKNWSQEYKFHDHQIERGLIPGKSPTEIMKKVTTVLEENNISNYAFTGPGAGSLWTDISNVRTSMVYLPYFPDKQILNTIPFEKSSRGPNFWFVVPNDNAVMLGQKNKKHITTVSPVQLYLDLRSSDIVFVHELIEGGIGHAAGTVKIRRGPRACPLRLTCNHR